MLTGYSKDYKNNRVFPLASGKHDPKERGLDGLKQYPAVTFLKATPTIALCSNHWPTGYETIIRYGKERPHDPPLIFSSVKQNLIATPPPPPRPTTKAQSSSPVVQEYKQIFETRYDQSYRRNLQPGIILCSCQFFIKVFYYEVRLR